MPLPSRLMNMEHENEQDSLPEDWTDEETGMYLKMYRFMSANQVALCPPAFVVSPAHWDVIAHNCARVAAELLTADSLRVLDADTQETIAESPNGAAQ